MSEVKTMAKFSVPKITYSRKGEEQGLIYESTNPPTYDEMLGKIAGMSYESPIDIVLGEMQFKFEQDVMKAIQSYGICVDRDELIKALQYDRHQYEKGFADACKLNTQGEWISVDERLPELKEEVRTWGELKIQPSVRVLCACEQKSGKVFIKEGFYELWGSKVVWKIPGSIDSVTHWMPLPEAPKMKGGEE